MYIFQFISIYNIYYVVIICIVIYLLYGGKFRWEKLSQFSYFPTKTQKFAAEVNNNLQCTTKKQ